MIGIKHLKKEYVVKGGAANLAIKDISLNIEEGEFVAIMGASGSGKSTLLNVIGCMDVMTEGEYYFNEIPIHSITKGKIHKFRKEHISFVFQNFALMQHYNVYENVELPLVARNMAKKKRKQIVMEQLERMGIADLSKKLPSQISGGQQQRCAIARALASGNELILADEPTGALDSGTSKEIMDIFEEMNRNGKTIVLVTHDMNVANRTKRIIEIKDGMLLSDRKS